MFVLRDRAVYAKLDWEFPKSRAVGNLISPAAAVQTMSRKGKPSDTRSITTYFAKRSTLGMGIFSTDAC